jgi:large subunit ribosomal protein L25
MDQKLTLDVPLHLTGTPVGVENGGELMHLKRDLKVSCLPGDLPDFIEVDVSGLEIGDSLKVQDVPVQEGITVLDSSDVGVAMVFMSKGAASKAAEAEEEAEGETSTEEASAEQ